MQRISDVQEVSAIPFKAQCVICIGSLISLEESKSTPLNKPKVFKGFYNEKIDTKRSISFANAFVTSPLVHYPIKTQGLPQKRSVKC